jgi:FixJ family two-component response regulator
MTLAVVDDDVSVRTALGRLLRSLGHDVALYSSAEEYEADAAPPDCLILDVRLPGLNGLELRERLRRAGSCPPVVFITGDGDSFMGEDTRSIHPMSVEKPFDADKLMAAIDEAVSADRTS